MATSDFLRSETTQIWLRQFEGADENLAVEMLARLILVSSDDFAERLQALVVQRSNAGKQPVAIYVEREVRRRNGIPHRLFKEKIGRVRRAVGAGPSPVQPTRAYEPFVGSEGIVAQLMSELCKANRRTLFLNPGPDRIRKYKIRRFLLVTDFIGTGGTARTFLESAWRVRSVRSWWSARRKVGLTFEVLGFAATARGQRFVESHSSAPTVHVVTMCPTVAELPRTLTNEIRDLCVRYDPVCNDPANALGYGGTGALIAFAHGAPNNTPRLLHKDGQKWSALFPRRVTSATRQTFATAKSGESVTRALLALGHRRLSESLSERGRKYNVRLPMVVLAALTNAPRNESIVSRLTGLDLGVVRQFMLTARRHGLIDAKGRLTSRGTAELTHSRRMSRRKPELASDPEMPYYPTSLRAPLESSS